MPSRLSLRDRRMLARGINPRTARAWAGRVFLSKAGMIGNRAFKTFGTGNAAYEVHSRKPGTAGNSTTFRVVVAGVSTPASVVVTGAFETGNATVTFNAATNASSVATSTVTEMARLVNGSVTARPIVHVQRGVGSDGTGVVAAVAATALAGAT